MAILFYYQITNYQLLSIIRPYRLLRFKCTFKARESLSSIDHRIKSVDFSLCCDFKYYIASLNMTDDPRLIGQIFHMK